MTTNRTWTERAKCAGSGIDFFSYQAENRAKMKALCNACTVSAECRAYSLSPFEDEGWWANTLPDDRRDILKTDPKYIAEYKAKGWKPISGPRHREQRV